MRTIGDRVKVAREHRGFSQAALAQRAGVSNGTIGNLESNARKKPRELSSIADALGVPMRWLEHGTGPMPAFVGPASDKDSAQSPGQVPIGISGDRPMSDPAMHDAPLITWGDAMQATNLPDLFWLDLPDDSMAPRARAGKRMGFSRGEPVKGGAGILVRDRAGVLYFRRYVAAAGGQWIARAENPDYADMHSERDGLQLVAVLIAEWGGWH